MSFTTCLPQEILEGIIDFLHDDRRSLHACSLASLKLVTASRHHLYSETTISFSKFQRLLLLLDAPWSSLANTIIRLVITGEENPKKSAQERLARKRALKLAGGGVRKEHVFDNPSRIHERLQRVGSVRLSGIPSNAIPDSFWALLAAMKGVKAVETHRIGLQCPLSFFRFVASLPLLAKLSISRPTISTGATRLVASRTRTRICEGGGVDFLLPHTGTGPAIQMPLLDLRRTSQLPTQDQSLHASTVAGISVLEWMLIQNPRPSVKTLRLNLDYEQEMLSLLSTYLQSAGSQVENLCVVLPSCITGLHNMPLIELSQITRIQHLHVEGLFTSHDTSTHILEPYFRGLFAQLLCPSSLTNPVQRDAEVAAPSPLISQLTFTLTVDAKNEASFFGMPDHTMLQTFTWFSLPEIIEEVLAPFPDVLRTLQVQLRVRMAGAVSDRDRLYSEDVIRGGVWKKFAEQGRTLRVGILPMLDREGDYDDSP
ncbi:hypothetical protein JR316_0003894 [Psilocybe cubensis]|uniref:Uncharacterized protein n=2 Tax=Psilocybe cubensis TaxID=181762 RepID=A0ACB8H8T2_PSICU|nr:hypothetical protein JR316_0003894 [Psilocybe cubensis]KAH9484413.1 hypothetical protein JR316_0003894 [Psilocybe cubensis]